MDIGLQLYSGRNFDLATVLALAARLGYSHVEGYGAIYGDPAKLKALLDESGLTMPTAHVGLADLEDIGKTLGLARSLGMKLIVCPILPLDQRPSDADGWRRVGDRLERLAKAYAAEGYVCGYHNHDFEFARFGDHYAIDLLLREAPTLVMEADIAWMTRGGADVLTWLGRNGPRIAAVHVKDLAAPGQAADEGGWADVGHGVMPWDVLARAVLKGTAATYFVAEHDNPKDFERFARRSIAAIRALFAPAGQQ